MARRATKRRCLINYGVDYGTDLKNKISISTVYFLVYYAPLFAKAWQTNWFQSGRAGWR